MQQENFHAGVQYNDSTGTAAADDHDNRDMSHFLKEKGLIQNDEHVVGIKLWSGEVHGDTQDRPIYVTVFVATPPGLDNIRAAVESGNPLHVRKIRLEMMLNEFFGLFKRFEICISSHGIIDRRDITFED